jgi:sugar/nucleoside kinase (ribokinase family)
LDLSSDLRWQIASFVVDVVDTKAAGDMFCGTLAAGCADRKLPTYGIRFTSVAAAMTVP